MPQYQGIWSLAQQSQAVINQQWVTDPDFKNTTLLLQADGTASGSQNHEFRDSSTNNLLITRNEGNTTQGSFSPFSRPDGEWSNFFNGTSAASAIVTAANANLSIGTGDVTVEFWMNTRLAVDNGLFGTTNEAAWNDNSWSFVYNTNVISLYNGNGGGILWNITTGTLHDGIWRHIAIVRSSGIWQVFVDGVSKGTTATQGTRSLGNNTWRFAIGNIEPGNSDLKYTGYFSNFRFNNTAVYTSNFTPSTTPLTAIAGTKFLTCQSNRFLDNSTNALTFTTPGSPFVRAFSPFSSRPWSADVVGGSGYFDRSSDYLTLAPGSAFAFGTGDFTVETWYYPTATPTDDYIIDARNSGQTNTWTLNFAYGGNNGELDWGYNGSILVSATTTTTVKPYMWSHIAYTRTGTTGSLYVNGARVGTGTDSTNYTVSPTTSYIGCRYSVQNFAGGYFSGKRVVKGTALYTGTSYTIPIAPPTAITNTSLLLNYTNAGIYDSTGQTNWETKALKDGTRVDTVIKKNGTGSFYFDGTQAYSPTERILPGENYPTFIFGTGDFTIESWLYCIGKPTSSTTSGIWDQRPGVNGTYINFVVDFGGYGGAALTPTLVLYADSATRLRSDVIPIARWFHAVLCRKSGVTRMYIDGKLACAPLADTRDYGSGGSAGNFRPVIGQTDGGDAFYGFMDDFRASRFCRYNSDFIPPKQAFPRQ
jgi:hypothetical protein